MRFLIVDDEFVALSKMRAMLEPYADCDSTSDGHEAMAMFREAITRGELYDLVTLDVEMPAMTGVELAAGLVAIEKEMGVAFCKKVMVTANKSVDTITQVAQSHVNAYLVKPVSKATLLSKLIDIGLDLQPKGAVPG